MRVGGMRHSIELWENKRVVDADYGGVKDNYVYSKTVKAQVRKSSGLKTQSNDKTISDIKLIIEVWAHHNMDETFRLKWRGKFYKIDFINPSYDDRTQSFNVSYVDN